MSGLSPPGLAEYSSNTIHVGDGTWDSHRDTFLLPNLVGLNLATTRYNGMGNRFKNEPQYRAIIAAHAAVGAVAFLGLIPVSIFVARFGNRRPKAGRAPPAVRWHIWLNLLSTILATVTLALGCFAVGTDRSLSNPHHAIGIALYVLVVVQMLVGVLARRTKWPRSLLRLRTPSLKRMFHQWTGRATAVLGLAQVPLGLALYGSPVVFFVLYALVMSAYLFTYFILSYKADKKMVRQQDLRGEDGESAGLYSDESDSDDDDSGSGSGFWKIAAGLALALLACCWMRDRKKKEKNGKSDSSTESSSPTDSYDSGTISPRGGSSYYTYSPTRESRSGAARTTHTRRTRDERAPRSHPRTSRTETDSYYDYTDSRVTRSRSRHYPGDRDRPRPRTTVTELTATDVVSPLDEKKSSKAKKAGAFGLAALLGAGAAMVGKMVGKKVKDSRDDRHRPPSPDDYTETDLTRSTPPAPRPGRPASAYSRPGDSRRQDSRSRHGYRPPTNTDVTGETSPERMFTSTDEDLGRRRESRDNGHRRNSDVVVRRRSRSRPGGGKTATAYFSGLVSKIMGKNGNDSSNRSKRGGNYDEEANGRDSDEYNTIDRQPSRDQRSVHEEVRAEERNDASRRSSRVVGGDLGRASGEERRIFAYPIGHRNSIRSGADEPTFGEPAYSSMVTGRQMPSVPAHAHTHSHAAQNQDLEELDDNYGPPATGGPASGSRPPYPIPPRTDQQQHPPQRPFSGVDDARTGRSRRSSRAAAAGPAPPLITPQQLTSADEAAARSRQTEGGSRLTESDYFVADSMLASGTDSEFSESATTGSSERTHRASPERAPNSPLCPADPLATERRGRSEDAVPSRSNPASPRVEMPDSRPGHRTLARPMTGGQMPGPATSVAPSRDTTSVSHIPDSSAASGQVGTVDSVQRKLFADRRERRR